MLTAGHGPSQAGEAIPMSGASRNGRSERLTMGERLVAGAVGIGVLAVALVIVVMPPQRRVALAQCPNATAGCIVRVDSDLTTFAAVLGVVGAVAILLAILGIRFNQVKVPGVDLGHKVYEEQTAGLPRAVPGADGEVGSAPTTLERPKIVPVEVDIKEGMGEVLHAAPVAVTQLTSHMRDVAPSFLRDYQSARKVSQHSHFLTHILGAATRPNQKYSVAIRVTPHTDATSGVTSASFYLGRSWGNKTFEGRRGPDGRFGIVTEAYGPFLALCEVEFDDGSRILLDHYCDFDMGSLLPS